MERLTFEGNFCDIAQCRELPCKYDGNCTQKEVWERLKQFEDAFGTPENAERVKLAFMGKSVYEIKEFNGVLLETRFGAEPVPITRPPQSWCYVEEQTWKD